MSEIQAIAMAMAGASVPVVTIDTQDLADKVSEVDPSGRVWAIGESFYLIRGHFVQMKKAPDPLTGAEA